MRARYQEPFGRPCNQSASQTTSLFNGIYRSIVELGLVRQLFCILCYPYCAQDFLKLFVNFVAASHSAILDEFADICPRRQCGHDPKAGISVAQWRTEDKMLI